MTYVIFELNNLITLKQDIKLNQFDRNVYITNDTRCQLMM